MPAYLASRCDLNTCTRLRAIIARRTRGMSSSLFPLNITPQITSIQPDSGLVKNPSGLTAVVLPCHEEAACLTGDDLRPGAACLHVLAHGARQDELHPSIDRDERRPLGQPSS